MTDVAVKKYEIMLLFTPVLSEKDVEKEITNLKKELSEQGGEITFEDFWGRRKLAYPIKKQEFGYYHVMMFIVDGAYLKEFEKNMRLNKNILRYLVTIPPKDEYQPVSGAEVEQTEDQYFTQMRAKKMSGRSRGGSKKVIAEVKKKQVSPEQNREEKLAKILSDDLNI